MWKGCKCWQDGTQFMVRHRRQETHQTWCQKSFSCMSIFVLWLKLWLGVNSRWERWGGRRCGGTGHCGPCRAMGCSGGQARSACTVSPGATHPRSPCSAQPPKGRGNRLAALCGLQAHFSSDIPGWKTSLLIIASEKIERGWMDSEFFSGWGSSRSRAKWTSWLPSKRKSLSLDLFPVFLLICAGQEHGQLSATCELKAISTPNLLSPLMSPASKHSTPHITARVSS